MILVVMCSFYKENDNDVDSIFIYQKISGFYLTSFMIDDVGTNKM